MYEILTGERLFVHAGLTTSADEIYSQPVPQVSRKVPNLTPELDAIMKKALSLDPEKRYQTAGEFQEALMRCAHRNGLLMSAPELGRELRDACGPTDQWRDDEDDDEISVPRAGTEVYDATDDEEEGALEIRPSGPLSIHNIAARARSPAAKSPPLGTMSPPLGSTSPPLRPKTEMGKFQGVELTSIINMMDLDDRPGSQPLVDLDSDPRLRAAPPAPSPRPALPPPSRAALPPPSRPPPVREMESDPALMSLVDSLPTARGGYHAPPQPQPPASQYSTTPLPDHGEQLTVRGGYQGPNAPMPPQPPFVPPPDYTQNEGMFATLKPGQVNPRPQAPMHLPPEGRRQKPSMRIERSSFTPWLVIGLIIVVAIIVTLIVAMSGPNVPTGK
jgi:hypothetical protein